jgi:hypothetical protein
MHPCTPLLLCCAVAVAADPPADKKDVSDRYAVRLAAAAAIGDSAAKAQALLSIAVEAAEFGQDDVVKKALAAYPKSVSLGQTDSGLTSLITRLAGLGHEAEALEAAKALADPYRDTALAGIAAGQSTGAAALWRACERGDDVTVVNLLATAALNAKDKDGETALMKAAANGHVAVVKRLFSAANIEMWEVDKQGRTALMKAAANGQEAVVRLFLTHYIDKVYPQDDPVNMADDKGQTALMVAASKGSVGVIQALLDIRLIENPSRHLTFEQPFGGPLVDEARKDNDNKTAQDLAEEGKHAGAANLLTKARKKAG